MFKQNANQAYYDIHLSEVEDDSINVLSFEGEEEISGLFEYRIEIVSHDMALDSSKILNKPATLTFIRGEVVPEKIHGIISNFEQHGRTPEYAFYKLVLVPKLWRLNLIYQNEVYQKMKIDKLIEEVLSDAGLKGSALKIDLKSQYPEQEYIVQYKETNFNFLNRKLEHYGIFYYFDHSSGSDIVVFTDANAKLPVIHSSEDVDYNENKDVFGDTETIVNINCSEKVVTGAVQLKDYNYMFPEKQLMAESQINSKMPGKYYDFGDNFENEKDAEFLAKIRNQEFISESKIFSGISDSRVLRAGYRFKLKKHFRDDWNSEYVILSLSIKGSQSGLFDLLVHEERPSPHFECKFNAIPFGIDYRPARRTPVPKISGIMSAKIESGTSDEYAFVDDHGRYKAKMLFDISDKSNGEATMPIRLVQNYTGSGYGTHFPNHKGTELLWACVDGNVDRPIGLGTVPNPSQASPVVSKNKMQNVIRTAAGNEIILDDKSKETQISIATTDLNKMLFDDKDDKIEITTKDKHIVTMDDKNQNIIIKSKDGHQIIIDDKNDNITIQSKGKDENDKKLYFIKIDHKNENIIAQSKAEHFIKIVDKEGEEKIELSDKKGDNHFLIDIKNNKLVIETKEGSIDMLAPKGDINIKSKNLKVDVTADFEVQAKGKITEEAKSDFKQKGMKIESEASTDYKLKGLNVTAEAGVNMQVKGTILTVEASGINTIKGALVKIN
ncbi:MAG: type VI secretion system tip protein TssI/VgrG [Ignavibacteriaceae bacterium]